MTILPSRSERDNIGIDSYERAILYSAVLLRKMALLAGINADDRISLNTTNAEQPKINIQAVLNYTPEEAWGAGGDFFDTIEPLTSLNPSGELIPVSPLSELPDFSGLDVDPPWVDNLEEFFVWAAIEIKGRLIGKGATQENLISYRFRPKKKPPSVEISISLPFRFSVWLEDRHFFNSLIPLLSPSEITELNNSAQLNNQQVLGN